MNDLDTARKLKNRIDKYFHNMEDPKFIPTFSGLKLYLNMDIDTWDNYANGRHDTDEEKYAILIEMAVLRIGEIIEKRMLQKEFYNPGLKALLDNVNRWLDRNKKVKASLEEIGDTTAEGISQLLKKYKNNIKG